MKAERFEQVDQIFQAALQREPAERAAFLDEVCGGDTELRSKVEALLSADEEARSFIERPAFELAAKMMAHEDSTIVVGQTIGPYQIVSRLASGGMGDVYLAHDSRLDRKVALKMLPESFTRDEQRLRRFEQEARAASALNHPNIITVFEIGKAESIYFIATEYIAGQTLRERMAGGRMKLGQALEIAIQVAGALASAHQAGIVHRDIKPENIMVREDGYVKVLDFGLAKPTSRTAIASSADSEAATRVLVNTSPGMIMGTVSYMSPEQARGLPVDARTDIWSLGAVLYEMIAGRVPFAGETPSDVIAQILQKEPPALTLLSETATERLDEIVAKALVKDSEERYQTVKDLALDLKRLKQKLDVEAEIERTHPPQSNAPGAVTTARLRLAPTEDVGAAHLTTSSAEYIVGEIRSHKRGALIALAALLVMTISVGYFAYSRYFSGSVEGVRSVAVLPFANEGGDPEMEYLSDGISESLINSLSQISRFKVIARTTVFRYKGKDVDPQAAGRELKVDTVLVGKVVRKGDSLIVQADLVDVADGTQLWGERYNRKMSDVLAVQEEIAGEISAKLQPRLTGEERERLAKRYTNDTDAYQLYLQGRYHWNKRTAEDLKKSVSYFEQAIARDSRFALAYAGLADSYIALPGYAAVPSREAQPKVAAAAMKALEIDDTLAEAHIVVAGLKHYYEWDFAGAEREYKRGIELSPNYAAAHQRYSEFLSTMGRHDEAIAVGERARELDPFSLVINSVLGRVLSTARQHDRAIEQLQKTLELDKNFALAQSFLGVAYLEKGMYEEAIRELKKGVALSVRNGEPLCYLGYAYAASGRRGEALKLLDEVQGLSGGKVSPYNVAIIYAGLGERDRAFEQLEKAYNGREEWLINLDVEKALDGLRSDPRFQDLLRRMGLKS